MNKTRIAILGATSHIAKGLIYHFLQEGGWRLDLFARSGRKVRDFLAFIDADANGDWEIKEGFADFMGGSHDVIINCIGVGTRRKLQGNYVKYFTTTERFDNLSIEYLREKNPEAFYISLSSGLVYGRSHSSPVVKDTATCLQINHMTPEDYYMVARINAETKHRALNGLNIVDLRLFSYFSRFIDLSDGYFISDVINSVLNGKELKTSNANIVRDFVHPEDLFALIRSVVEVRSINDAFDAYSAGSVSKDEILSYFADHYGMKYAFSDSLPDNSPTGFKHTYASSFRKAIAVGYRPKYTSMEAIKEESRYFLNRNQLK